MKKRVLLAVLAVICIVLALVLIDPMATKPWTWANRLSAEDVEEVEIGNGGELQPLTQEESAELLRLLRKTHRLEFQKNKYNHGPTPDYLISLQINGERHTISYYGIFELRCGKFQWWLRNDRLAEYVDSLLEKYDLTVS